MHPLRIWQVSDTHLSRSHAYFQDNWNEFVNLVEAEKPDFVIHSGDVAFNAPEVPDDILFGRQQLARLTVSWRVIPGNHDVGEPGEAPRLEQPVSAASLALWRQHFGDDCFCHDVGAWRLIGLNSELLGSGLDAEASHWAFLSAALADAAGRAIGLFVHKPLFTIAEDEGQSGMTVLPAARRRLLAALKKAGVKFIGSGHLHAYGSRTTDVFECVWCPTTAFVDPSRPRPTEVTWRTGFVEWQLTGDGFSHLLVQPPLFGNLDITNWTRSSGSTISLPPRPVNRQLCGTHCV